MVSIFKKKLRLDFPKSAENKRLKEEKHNQRYRGKSIQGRKRVEKLTLAGLSLVFFSFLGYNAINLYNSIEEKVIENLEQSFVYRIVLDHPINQMSLEKYLDGEVGCDYDSNKNKIVCNGGKLDRIELEKDFLRRNPKNANGEFGVPSEGGFVFLFRDYNANEKISLGKEELELDKFSRVYPKKYDKSF